MDLKSNTELIVALKRTIAEKNISQSELMKLMEDHGHPIAKTTIQRFFKEGSEVNDSFRYRDTLMPMAEVLLPDNVQQLDPIADLRNRIDFLEDQVEKYHDLIQKYIALSDSQIQIKDTRMERKDKWVQQLMDENKRLNDEVCKLLDKCNNCNKK